MSLQIPDSWTTSELGVIASIIGGGTPPSKDPANFSTDDGIPWITPADLSGYKEMYISRGKRSLTPRGYSTCSATMMPAGSVLFSSRAPIGYVAIASNELSTNQGFKSLDLHSGIDSRYIYFYLRHIKSLAEARATGTTFKELSGAAVSRLPVIIAPLNEQKRIADKLESLLARVDACRDRLDRILGILKRFRQSVLAAATSGELTADWREGRHSSESASTILEAIALQRSQSRLSRKPEVVDDQGIPLPNSPLPSSWAWCRIGNIAVVRIGGTPSRKVPLYWGGTTLWVSSGEVANNLIFNTREKITASGVSNSSAKIYPKGTVLMAMIGEGKTRGQASYLEVDAATNQNVAGLVFDGGDVNGRYVWLWCLSQYEANREKGSGGNQPALNRAKVSALPIALPPVDEQEEIVRRVETLLTYADRLEANARQSVVRLERMTPAILAKAFCGELVPQDPNDELAADLLERIRANQEATVGKKAFKYFPSGSTKRKSENRQPLLI